MPRQAFNFSLFLFAYYAYAGTFGTYATLYFAARGMTVPQIGVLMSLIPVMRIVGPNLWGWLADRNGRRAGTLRLTACGALLSFALLYFADTYFQLVAIMLLVNLFTSAQSPLMEALMLAEMRGDLSGYGKMRLWGSLGFVAAVVGAGYFFEWFGVQALLGFCCFLLLAVVAASLPIRDGAPLHAMHEKPPLWSVLKKPEVASFFLSSALMCGAHMALYAFYSLYLERAGYSKVVIGAMWALGVVAEVLFFYFQAPFFARFGARRLMLSAFALAALRFVITGAFPGVLWILVMAQLLHASTFAAHHSATVIAMQRWFAGPLQASGQALYMSVGYGIGCSVGGLLLTACWDSIGPQPMFYVAAGLCVAGAAAASYSFRRQGKTGL
ncbi:MFS transporter [Massilia sp. PAMC28688]|uniref:MFS transporter n=1 Tax=Massilia sp. PAMC28688 TaxID=2861283 RepID=UPI001C62A676|nr:MFS transporter [Massilia sp. PAMC28688]QYF93226.1 MFS transporter [Massilia sp. PAMC28688]